MAALMNQGGGDKSSSDPNRDPCIPFEMTPQTWVDMNVDEYLQQYPNAAKLTLKVRSFLQ